MAKGIRLLLGCLLVTLVASLPAMVLAGIPSKAVSSVRVFNESDSCAWITAYWSYSSEAHWRISAARWLKPNSQTDFSETFNHPPLGPQWRIRAEVRSKDSGQCRGSGGDPDIQGQFNVHIPSTSGMNPFPVVYCHDGATLRGSKSEGYKVYMKPYGNECRLR